MKNGGVAAIREQARIRVEQGGSAATAEDPATTAAEQGRGVGR